MTATVPFVYRFYPMVREARARVADGDTGPLRLLHGSYLQDWLAEDTDDDWRVDAAAGGDSRAFADIGVHWCDLVEFVSGHRITRLAARTVVAVPERGGRPVTTEDAAVVLFETDRGAFGNLTVSQISPGRKNRLWFSVDGATESLCFDQENPESLWIGGREVNRQLLRGAERAPGRGPLLRRPGRPPAGLPGLLRRLRRRHLRRPRRRGAPTGCPPSPTACAPPASRRRSSSRPAPAPGSTSPAA